ncbi:glycosyltransferase family 2 protein [Phaeobacter sp. B1627]|uniref:glycosyltransferase family 2 protein n=1 Tax=Phaeobacter sp. B1627 TaxID=2583809 RepID=UPI002104AB82|nr:glycosyltransferase family 2 protein [Phaeobacter sp. B1627]
MATVFCAVWHKQADKLDLLRSHWENLKAQSLPVEACYIFDNGDEAPDWLDATWHSFSEPLTIYEAWAAGVALSNTKYTMNLNMDDRLATDAVRMMVSTAEATQSALVAGDWLVSFDKSHLNAEFTVTDLWGTHHSPEWPLMAQPNLRLGSGSGDRGTFGPATLWNLDILGKWYPTHFNNNTPIQSIGDQIFWKVVLQNKQKATRLPLIIGRYFSDTNSQAEFRPHNDNAFLKTYGVNPVSFAQCVTSGDFSKRPGQAGAALDAEARDAAAPEALNAVEQASAQLAEKFRAAGLGAGAGPTPGISR